ncbi:potassium-transporting ATPase subunit KdpC [Parachlamydia sp. AcF125]|uniref:potassium-transporting ATPase subunit KdpC n=1 Tax=Parachlamydia sp. AcF125 TaxID=2795736 RepID=UPI001BC90A69|nr:potassium-transporting ATPase subunit KdpC [Parachlamydia sp. AcF125]MBS4167664.1 Potassium-transporting ATPase KdpC subunit [Parachlamydia sp. AcF125]
MNLFVQAFRMLIWMLLVLGILYPLMITVIAQVGMQDKANGGIIREEGKALGALLIAQKFESERYFWPRPSAVDYNPLSSGGSQLGPTSKILVKTIEERRSKMASAHQVDTSQVPAELLFTSGSGIDPHISLDVARFQIPRVAKARGLAENSLIQLLQELTIPPRFFILGEPHVNVLLLNQALDVLDER